MLPLPLIIEADPHVKIRRINNANKAIGIIEGKPYLLKLDKNKRFVHIIIQGKEVGQLIFTDFKSNNEGSKNVATEYFNIFKDAFTGVKGHATKRNRKKRKQKQKKSRRRYSR